MPKLLLVDDNELNCDMLARRLTRKGYQVSVAHDGIAGVAMAQGSHPDIILMDITLPLMDGTDATKRLKTDDSTKHIPVIALTAHAMEGDRKLALGAGFDDYDTKPVDMVRLLEKIGALLSRAPNLSNESTPSD
jgi:two-component system cell cycle response regulator DivK